MRRMAVLGLVRMAMAALVGIVGSQPLLAQIEIIPGNSERGATLFDRQGCVRCHAFGGVGGKRGPDLAQHRNAARTPDQLASAIWNHAPAMWDEARSQSVTLPPLASTDVADLFAHFYSLNYFSEAGDGVRGRRVFEARQCALCHTSTVRPGLTQGPLVEGFGMGRDPLTWAGSLWNHAQSMLKAVRSSGLRWPELSSQDVVDLMAFVRTVTNMEASRFRPGNPEPGRVTFERSCESCHTFGRAMPGKVDLADRPGEPRTLTDYVATMWNHAPHMPRQSVTLPRLSRTEMADLVAYLFAQRHFSQRGNVVRGRAVYAEKRCSTCHELRRTQYGAPDLTTVTERFSPVTMTAAVWRHGPAMQDALRRDNLSWPRFSGNELADLTAYLNSRIVPRVARQTAPSGQHVRLLRLERLTK